MSVRLTERVSAMISEAIETVAMGDDISHDVFVIIAPGPDNQPAPLLVMILVLPSLVLGEYVVGSMMLPNVLPTQENVTDSVHSLVEGLRTNRFEQATKAQADHTENGARSGWPTSGPSSPLRP